MNVIFAAVVGLMLVAAPARAQAGDHDATTGSIILYRGSSILGAALGCPARYKGNTVVDLKRGKFGEWKVPAGRYILSNKTSSVEVSVSAGETRYVRCIIKAGFLTGRADLQVVDRENFEGRRDELEEVKVPALAASTSGN